MNVQLFDNGLSVYIVIIKNTLLIESQVSIQWTFWTWTFWKGRMSHVYDRCLDLTRVHCIYMFFAFCFITDLNADIMVLGDNYTSNITSEFCAYCNNTSKLFNYNVKLSQYFSYEQVTLEFRSVTVYKVIRNKGLLCLCFTLF